MGDRRAYTALPMSTPGSRVPLPEMAPQAHAYCAKSNLVLRRFGLQRRDHLACGALQFGNIAPRCLRERNRARQKDHIETRKYPLTRDDRNSDRADLALGSPVAVVGSEPVGSNPFDETTDQRIVGRERFLFFAAHARAQQVE